MSTATQSSAAIAGAQQSTSQADPHEIGWQDVTELGLDPAPAGMTEDSETQQV